MSLKATTWVFDHSPYTGGARLVHLALADVANEAYHNRLWLLQRDIADKARLSISQVQRILRTMVDDGALLVVDAGGGRGNPATYEMVMSLAAQSPAFPGAPAGLSQRENPASETPKAPRIRPENPASVTPRLLLTQGTQGKTTQMGAFVPQFDAFWKAYPRKAAKAAAERAWAKATLRADPAAIVAGAKRYRDDANREPAFTAHPATWLNADRWADDPLPQRSTRSPLRGRHAEPLEVMFGRALGAQS